MSAIGKGLSCMPAEMWLGCSLFTHHTMLLHVKKFCGTEGYRMVENSARSMSLRGNGDMHCSHARDVMGCKNVEF